MKTLIYFICLLFASSLTIQGKSNVSVPPKAITDTVKVWGNCDMCKKNIETAAKKVSGVISAQWDKNTKKLTLTYQEGTKLRDIEQAIANAGYDTRDIKAGSESYDKLSSCCKYTRE